MCDKKTKGKKIGVLYLVKIIEGLSAIYLTGKTIASTTKNVT